MGLSVSPKNFFVENRQPATLSSPDNEHWICLPKSVLGRSAYCRAHRPVIGFSKQGAAYQNWSMSARKNSYPVVSAVGIFENGSIMILYRARSIFSLRGMQWGTGDCRLHRKKLFRKSTAYHTITVEQPSSRNTCHWGVHIVDRRTIRVYS